jgi:AraC-like DNA-binding protein
MPISPAELAILAFERATALHVSLHAPETPLAGLLNPARFMHRHPICLAAKGLRMQRCVGIDGERTTLASADGQVRIKLCHAGVVEWTATLPVGPAGRWQLFAGQRRAGADLRPDLAQRVEPGAWRGELALLPVVDRSEAAWLAELLAQLRGRLSDLLIGPLARVLPPAAAGSRAVLIHRLISEYHMRPFRLAELARYLGLSPLRAGHAVHEACGAGFVDLLTAERLATAARMLRETTLPVAEIARASGFADISRFHRCFRERFGNTPAAFRQRDQVG